MTRAALPALTGVRFLAAAWVVAYHLGKPWIASSTGPLRDLLAGAPFAVTLFFALSGFILVYVHAPAVEPRAFAAARFARLAPTYAFALLLAVPIGLAARHAGLVHDGVGSLFFVATATQAWIPSAALQWDPPLWSLSVEVAFYAVFPFLLPVVMKASTRSLVVAGAAAWLASIAVGIATIAIDPEALGVDGDGTWLHVVRFNPVLHLPTFLIGMSAGRCFLDGRRLPGFASIVAALVVVAGCASGGVPFVIVNGALFAPCAAVIVLALASSGSTVLSSTPLRILGESSYALYALHIPVWMWLAWITHTKTDETNKLLVVVVALSTSIATHFVVERTLRGPLRRALS